MARQVRKLMIGWIGAVRPSRRPLRGLLRTRKLLMPSKTPLMLRSARQGASRSTQGGDDAAQSRSFAFLAALALVFSASPAAADEEPKHGGTLNYMIPADAPPSLDGHRESTYATVH